MGRRRAGGDERASSEVRKLQEIRTIPIRGRKRANPEELILR